MIVFKVYRRNRPVKIGCAINKIIIITPDAICL
nr:MAG TPA_asm: hypothetical protein [Caudoviricetes sp.]